MGRIWFALSRAELEKYCKLYELPFSESDPSTQLVALLEKWEHEQERKAFQLQPKRTPRIRVRAPTDRKKTAAQKPEVAAHLQQILHNQTGSSQNKAEKEDKSSGLTKSTDVSETKPAHPMFRQQEHEIEGTFSVLTKSTLVQTNSAKVSSLDANVEEKTAAVSSHDANVEKLVQSANFFSEIISDLQLPSDALCSAVRTTPQMVQSQGKESPLPLRIKDVKEKNPYLSDKSPSLSLTPAIPQEMESKKAESEDVLEDQFIDIWWCQPDDIRFSKTDPRLCRIYTVVPYEVEYQTMKLRYFTDTGRPRSPVPSEVPLVKVVDDVTWKAMLEDAGVASSTKEKPKSKTPVTSKKKPAKKSRSRSRDRKKKKKKDESSSASSASRKDKKIAKNKDQKRSKKKKHETESEGETVSSESTSKRKKNKAKTKHKDKHKDKHKKKKKPEKMKHQQKKKKGKKKRDYESEGETDSSVSSDSVVYVKEVKKTDKKGGKKVKKKRNKSEEYSTSSDSSDSSPPSHRRKRKTQGKVKTKVQHRVKHDLPKGRPHELGRGRSHDFGRGRFDELGRGRLHDIGRGRFEEFGRGRLHDFGRGRGNDFDMGRGNEFGRGRRPSFGRGYRNMGNRLQEEVPTIIEKSPEYRMEILNYCRLCPQPLNVPNLQLETDGKKAQDENTTGSADVLHGTPPQRKFMQLLNQMDEQYQPHLTGQDVPRLKSNFPIGGFYMLVKPNKLANGKLRQVNLPTLSVY